MNSIQSPFLCGIPRMTVWLRKQGHKINYKRVERLMAKMGMHAIYPKPRLI